MTVQRRTRRHSPVSDQQDRLRALTLDASPTAQRLRARIPRPPVESLPPSGDGPRLPSPPYAVTGAGAPYRPSAPGSTAGPARCGLPSSSVPPVSTGTWPERDPDDLLSAPPPRAPSPVEAGGAPVPGREDLTEVGSVRGRAPGGPPKGASESDARPWRDPAEGRHRRPERPPSGYAEFDPGPTRSFLERVSQRWAPNAVLSRRAVLTLIVLGVLAVALVLALHNRPTTVSAPEMVTRAAPAEHPGPEEGGGAVEAPEGSGEAGPAAPEADLVVHVGGEVEDPGLYALPPGSRVADAVEEAGGARPEADLDLLNLARPLVDGEQVLVGVPPTAGEPGGPAQGTGGLVDVNQADKALLETLPGVGPVIAENIIGYREEHGPFTSVDDLVNVNRIGEKMLTDLRPRVTVG